MAECFFVSRMKRLGDERDRDHAGEIIIEPGLVVGRLEPERDRLDGAAENRDGERLRKADAGRAY
jgi:hypothetical protein